MAIAGFAAAILIALFNLTPSGKVSLLATTETASPAPNSVPVAAGDIVGVASIVDGDTLDIHGTRIRLSGIDAPESHQMCKDATGRLWRCGASVANALDAFIGGNTVSCSVVDTDRYGRSVSVCSVRGKDIQQWLAVNGYALAYRQYSTAYVADEEKAHRAKAGIWAGEFVNPADWRKGLRLDGEKPTKAMTEGKISAD